MKSTTKIFFKSLSITLALCLAFAPTSVHTQSALHQTNLQDTPHQNAFVRSDNYIAICALLLLTLHANKKGKTYKDQCDPLTLLKNFGEVYTTLAVTTLSHEFGHAISAYLLNNTSLNMHIGSRNTSKTALCQIGPISIDSFNPMVGYSYIGTSNSNYKNLIIHAAGPLGGIIGYYLFKIVKVFLKKTKKSKNSLDFISKLNKSVKIALTQASPLDSIALGHLLYLLVPMNDWGDGSKIWKLLGADENTVNRLGKIGPLIIYALPTLFALIVSNQKHTAATRESLLPLQ